MMSSYPDQKNVEESVIDFKELFYFFWQRRIYIYKITGAFFLIGVMVVILSRVEYESNSTLLPESQGSSGTVNSLLQRYSGLFGVSGASEGGGANIPTSLYPDIIQSLPYQVELMNKKVTFSKLDTTMTIHEYFRDYYPPSTFDYIKRYTIGLPGQIVSLFKGSGEAKSSRVRLDSLDSDSVVDIPGEYMRTIGELRNRLIIEQGTENALITLKAELPDPLAAAEIGKAALSLLKQYVREYRTQKAMDNLEFVSQQVKEAKKRFEEVQNKLAEFRDSNLNLATAKARTREQELQSQYDLAFNLYNSLSENLEQAKLRVQEETPVFTTVEPFKIPTGNSSPKTSLILIVWSFLGILSSIVYVLLKKQWEEFQNYVSANEAEIE